MNFPMLNRNTFRNGNVYINVLVVIGILALGVSMLLPSLCGARETANRVKCASNLRQIGQGMLLYANDNNGQLPRAKRDNSGVLRYFTAKDDDNPFDGVNDPAPNDVTMAFFMIVRTEDLGTEVFTCPSGKAEKMILSRPMKSYSNFESQTNLSYALANPYPQDDGKYSWMMPEMKEDFALAADLGVNIDASALTSASPQSGLKKFNSKNHDQDGENVLYIDGHVEFQNTPFAGHDRDYIYGPSPEYDGKTAHVGPPGVVPLHANDSILLPTEKD